MNGCEDLDAAGVKPQHHREGNLSGPNEAMLSQGGVGGKNPEILWKTLPRGKALGNDPCCVGLGGVEGIPLFMPHLYTFRAFTFTKRFGQLMMQELHWSLPGRILSLFCLFLAGKRCKPAALV